MMPTELVCAGLLAVLVGPATVRGAGDPAAEVAAAERAFSAQATKETTRSAFLVWLAPNAIVFRPWPVVSRSWTIENPQWGNSGLLTWDPAVVEVSSAGDLGFSTGPYEYRADRDRAKPPQAAGYFFSIWRRQADGEYRVELDLGTSNPKRAVPEPPYAGPRPRVEEAARPVGQDGRDELAARDVAFGRAIAASGARAYDGVLSDASRLHRDGEPVAIGRDEVRASLARWTARSERQEGAGMARSGDLGYAYGRYGSDGGDAGVYLRVWRRDAAGVWRIVAEVVSPVRI